MAEKLTSILQSNVIQDDNTKNKLLGAAFVVVNKDGPLASASAGHTNLPVSTSPAFTPASLAWAASMTKLLATISVLQLVERKLLTLDEDVRPRVPELAKAQILRGFDESKSGAPILEPNTSPITIRQLLTHTSGFGYDFFEADLQRWAKFTGTPSEIIGASKEGWNWPLVFAPGGEGRWAYGVGIDWAGVVLEHVTGQSLGQYMRENLFGPLGTKDTTFRSMPVSDDLEARKVRLSFRNPEDGTLTVGEMPIRVDGFEHDSGGAGIWTTAEEYARVLVAVLNGGGGVLGREMVDEMFQPQLTEEQAVSFKKQAPPGPMMPDYVGVEDHEQNFGLGGALNLKDLPGRRKAGSLMWSGICNAHWWVDRETGIAGVLIVAVLPFGDAVVNQMYRDLEAAAYEAFVTKP